MEPWERRKILIWGKTRPELSTKYRETVCTGGVFADTKSMVRLYPIQFRYLAEDKEFKKYQWIEAAVQKAEGDPRPESYRIRCNDLVVNGFIAPRNGDWRQRAKWIFGKDHVFSSVESLWEQQRLDRTSLGLVKPGEILEIRSTRLSDEEVKKERIRWEQLSVQMDLPFGDRRDEKLPIEPPEYRFRVRFRCPSSDCNTDHNMSILDWEPYAMYYRERSQRCKSEAAKVVVDRLYEVCGEDKDLFFYLGNTLRHQQSFFVVGIWWESLERSKQGQLF